jgi:hypothetical protein
MTQAWLPWLLLLQGVLAGVDTLLNHELIARLPQRQEARTELGVHVFREVIWAILLFGLAWFAWQGAAAALIAALLLAEVLITAWDELVENRSRVLPHNERVLHVFLVLNLGAVITVLYPLLVDWGSRPTALVAAGHGVISWIISVFAVCAAAWAVRDFLAWRRLRRASVPKNLTGMST